MANIHCHPTCNPHPHLCLILPNLSHHRAFPWHLTWVCLRLRYSSSLLGVTRMVTNSDCLCTPFCGSFVRSCCKHQLFFERDHLWISTSTTTHPNSNLLTSVLSTLVSFPIILVYIMRFAPNGWYVSYFSLIHSTLFLWQPALDIAFWKNHSYCFAPLWCLYIFNVDIYNYTLCMNILTMAIIMTVWWAVRSRIRSDQSTWWHFSFVGSLQNASLVRPWHSNKHCFVLVHLIFCTTYYLSSHFEDDNNPAWFSKWIFLDAQNASAYRSLQDIYTKNISSFQWPCRREDLASYQWNCVRRDSWEKFLWSRYVLQSQLLGLN